MFLNLFLGILCLSLINPAKPDCAENFFYCFESGDLNPVENCDSEENNSWIPYSQFCDGINNCRNGEDETIFNCKQHPLTMQHHYFYCASGGVNDFNKTCDSNELRCSDRSNILLCVEDVDWMKDCNESEFECAPSECIHDSKVCNGIHDCSNGHDESIDVCYKLCKTDEFQCGNGMCVNINETLCNGSFDCPDGSDELPIVCNKTISSHYTTPPYYCTQPALPLTFALGTKSHRQNGTKYVLPNESVQFECHQNGILNGSKWNVCNQTGEWAHALPTCDLRP